MKVMGSALMAFQAIVIGLAMPVAIVVGGHRTAPVVWTGVALMVLCLLSIGALRRDRRTAVAAGTAVQLLVIAAGVVIHAYLVPGLVFLAVWLLAVRLSARTDAAGPVN